MRISIIREAGYEQALLGVSLNKNQPPEKMPAVAKKLVDLGGGHNQFLQHMVLWMDVTASRGWWHQFAKYHFKEEQSESTTHTITRKGLFKRGDFLNPDLVNTDHLEYLNAILCSGLPESEMYEILTENLPEGFLQRRIVTTNYQTLRNIYHQRAGHKRPEWLRFIHQTFEQVEHPEFLVGVLVDKGLHAPVEPQPDHSDTVEVVQPLGFPSTETPVKQQQRSWAQVVRGLFK